MGAGETAAIGGQISCDQALTIIVVTCNSEGHIERLARSLPDAPSGVR